MELELFPMMIPSFLMGMAQHWLPGPNALSISEKASQFVEQFMIGHQ